jgi:hypothetical protein
MVLANGLHDGHVASAIVAAISLFARYTAPRPTPTSAASTPPGAQMDAMQ